MIGVGSGPPRAESFESESRDTRSRGRLGIDPPGQRSRRAKGRATSTQLALELPRTTQAPGIARRWVVESFAEELDRRTQRTAELLVSELVTNAVVHGRGKVEIHARLGQDRLIVEVIDEGPGFAPPVCEHDPDTVGGCGLRIVDEEASRWGIREGAAHVWFELARHLPSADRKTSAPIPNPQRPRQGPSTRRHTGSAGATGDLASTHSQHPDAGSARHHVASRTELPVSSARSPTRPGPSGASGNRRRGRAERAALYRRVADTLERWADLAEQYAERERHHGHRQSMQIELERAERARQTAKHGRAVSTQLQ